MNATTGKTHAGFVLTDRGEIYVQVPDANKFGFVIQDDDQAWQGGIGVANAWEAIEDSDPRITAADHERLDWILEEARSA